MRRLRWWHRNRCWLGYNGWRYHWDGRYWIGVRNGVSEQIALTGRHDTKDYGPYRCIYLNRWGERTI